MVLVESATERDLLEIINLLNLVWRNTYRGIIDDKFILIAEKKVFTKKRFLKKLRDQSVSFLVAREEEKIVGIVISRKLDFNTIYIASLYIHPIYQGKGIGKLLMKRIVNEYDSIKEIWLNVIKKNSKAVVFYEKNGFIMGEIDDIETGVFGVEVRRMRKKV